jgi:hypothetical protein
VVIDAAIQHADRTAEGQLSNLIAGEDLARGANKQQQNIEFRTGQLDRLIAAKHPAGMVMDHHISNPQNVRRSRFRPAPEDGTHSRHQFPRIERFG